MIYAAVLAGGAGKRMMGEMPKQFLPFGGKCILSHTAERFSLNAEIGKVLVAVPFDRVVHARGIFFDGTHAIIGSEKIEIIAGGRDRNSSLMAAVKSIEETSGIRPDDIIVSHDAVRPFVTQRIINENIALCRRYGAAGTACAMIDTPVISDDGKVMREIPSRSNYYVCQTPQTFNIALLKEAYASLTDDEKESLTDACKIMVLYGKTVGIVAGERYNIKITTPFDYSMALAMLEKKFASSYETPER